MSKMLNQQPFDIHSQEKDVVILRDYQQPEGSTSLAYKRIAPKRSKDFPGMEKSELKLTVTGSNGELIGLITVNTSFRADVDDTVKSLAKTLILAACADNAWNDLLMDQKLPLNLAV